MLRRFQVTRRRDSILRRIVAMGLGDYDSRSQVVDFQVECSHVGLCINIMYIHWRRVLTCGAQVAAPFLICNSCQSRPKPSVPTAWYVSNQCEAKTENES